MNAIEDRAKTIFLNAAEIASTEVRQAFVEAECGGEESLRQEVEDLLRHHRCLGSFLESPAIAIDVEQTALLDGGLSEAAGTVLGPYKLLQKIGEGGMGVVYMAEQERPMRRRVALKIIKAGMDTRDVVARFEAERQALAMMDHPNIAKVFDAGATENGRPYFVMELVQGVPITDYCDRCNLTTDERLELFTTVCQAVQHAHQKGVIHRDIKPTNVLVEFQDGRPAPKIIDFGVAKAINQQLTDHTLMTAFAQIVGTPLYMSPEQAELSPLGIDTRSDVYSLGVLLYELLCSTTPFDKDRLHAASYDELRRIIREEEPPRPSARISTLAADVATTVAERRRTDVRHLRQTVCGELDWIVMKCLEKERNRRYESAGSLADEVNRYLRDEPVQACPPSASYRFRKFARRNKTVLAAAGAIAVALVVGLGLSTWMFLRERAAMQAAKVNERRAITESANAKSVSDLLQEMLGSADTDRAKGSQYTVRELLDDFSAGLVGQLAQQPEVEADIRATIGRAYLSLRLPDRAQPHFEKAIDIQRRIGGPQHVKLAALLVDYGWNFENQQKFVEAEAHLREALDIYHSERITGAPVIHALRVLELVMYSSNQSAAAETVYRQALAIVGNSDEEFRDLANLQTVYASLLNKEGRFGEAEHVARRAVDLHRRVHGDHHADTAWGLKSWGDALQGQQRLEEAEKALGESRRIFRRSFSAGHPYVQWATGSLESVLKSRGEASRYEALAQDEAEQTIRSDNPVFQVRLAELLLTHNPSIETQDAEAHRLIGWAIDGFGKVAAEAQFNLDRRLDAMAGYAEIAALCASGTGFNHESDEVNRRLKAGYPELLAASPNRATSINIHYTFALAHLRLGDKSGYSQACEALYRLPAGNESGDIEFRRIWAWCLAPDALKEFSGAQQQAEDLVANNPGNSDYLLALGGVLYRDGKYGQAAQRLVASIDPNENRSAAVVYSQLLLAMTKWQLGERDVARRLLDETQSAADKDIQAPSTHWNRRTSLKLLGREAHALIGPEPTDQR